MCVETGTVTENDEVMTKVIYQCYLQIDKGVRLENEDPFNENAELTNHMRQEWRELNGLTGWSIEDFNKANQSPNFSFTKQFGKRIVNSFMNTFPPLDNSISDFYEHFNQ